MIWTPVDMKVGSVHKTELNGDLTIVRYGRNDDVEVLFKDTGSSKITSSQKIRQGIVRDDMKPIVYGVGFIGIGEFRSRDENRQTKHYDLWHDMLKRCYSDKYHARKPTYKDCTVCDDWHNFQNFCAWFEANKPKSMVGISLDKDIKIAGNKIYSPETCLFVTTSENSRAATEYKMYDFSLLSPIGNVETGFNQTEFAELHNLDRRCLNDLIKGRQKTHRGWKVAP